jgi:hypothetical protein
VRKEKGGTDTEGKARVIKIRIGYTVDFKQEVLNSVERGRKRL